ncbi:MAG: NUDIX hydrolase [bacterium]|nr:NUDIX hydrolase [bacterium]
MKFDEKTIKANYIYQGKVINVRVDDVMLPNDTEAKREIVEHRGGVGIIPYDGENVYLVNQYRYALRQELLEIPAGKREFDENPIETAKRELYEEVGATAKNFTYLGEYYPTVGYCEEIIYLFLATDLKFSNRLHLDQDEFLEVKKMKLTDAIALAKNNEIKDAKTVIALLKCGDYID